MSINFKASSLARDIFSKALLRGMKEQQQAFNVPTGGIQADVIATLTSDRFPRVYAATKELDKVAVRSGVLSNAGISYRPAISEAKKQEVRSLGFTVPSNLYSDQVVNIIDYAIANEFGTSFVPPRPFLQTTYNLYGQAIKKIIRDSILEIYSGEIDASQFLSRVGTKYVGFINKIFDESFSFFEPLAEVTKIIKGSSQPLVDQGDLKRAINFRVDK